MGRQGGDPARSAAFDLRRQAARGRPHVVGLQHPERVHPPLGVALAGWLLLVFLYHDNPPHRFVPLLRTIHVRYLGLYRPFPHPAPPYLALVLLVTGPA